LEKRKGKKAAAEKYEPIKGHFPGADFPLTVAQIDHTPMDVIVVDEEHRQPIQRPSLTVVIDVSRLQRHDAYPNTIGQTGTGGQTAELPAKPG
jgi:hypothetical protein